jgi:ASC-1-like (ASCH) protein
MKKSWSLLPKILSGEKTIESRWYKTKRAPWGRIFPEDTIYFKNSGEPIMVKAAVEKVEEICIDSGFRRNDIPTKICAPKGFEKLIADKKYCILIYLKNPRKIKPFEINKKGFGAMAAWITLPTRRLFRSLALPRRNTEV